MNDSNYRILCTKSISGQITPDEKQKLEQWLNTAPENRAYYDEISQTWNMTNPPAVLELPDVREEWKKLERTLGLKVQEEKPSISVFGLKKITSRLIGLLEPKYRPAAISFASVVILAVGFLILKDYIMGPRIEQVLTLNKQKMDVTLSDGSRVLLNYDSYLRFAKVFPDSIRQVMLTGEAFFEVTHEERPFVVITENAITTVLGTKFNIRARDEETRVIVKEGCVRLTPMEEQKGEIVLSEGQMSQVSGNVLPQEPLSVDADHMLGWMENKLVFVRTPLREIIGELQRYYDLPIETMNPEQNEKTLTATFENLPIETVLSSICLTLDVQYTVDNETYRIMDKP